MQQAQQSIAVERRFPVAAPGAPIVNDTGLLNAEQIPAFRAFLVESGLETRDSGAGQFFHVRLPELSRWLPIERGRAGAPVTPDVLRPFIASFLKLPLATAIGEVRAARHAAERNVARAALAQPVVVEVATDPMTQFQEQATAPARAAMAALEPVDRKAPAPLSRYLSDLRDDLALHAPVRWDPELSAEANAIRRWEYADVMLATRTTKAGD